MSHTWSSADLGADVIEVPSTDPNFGLGQYYIAVYGGGGGTECRFHITVDAQRPLIGASGGADLLGHGKTAEVKLAAVQAHQRRLLTKAGRNAAELMQEAGGAPAGLKRPPGPPRPIRPPGFSGT